MHLIHWEPLMNVVLFFFPFYLSFCVPSSQKCRGLSGRYYEERASVEYTRAPELRNLG